MRCLLINRKVLIITNYVYVRTYILSLHHISSSHRSAVIGYRRKYVSAYRAQTVFDRWLHWSRTLWENG